MKKAIVFANDFEQVAEGMGYAERKGYQVIALKNKNHDIIGEQDMEVLLIPVNKPKYRTYEEILFIEKMSTWYDIELVEMEVIK